MHKRRSLTMNGGNVLRNQGARRVLFSVASWFFVLAITTTIVYGPTASAHGASSESTGELFMRDEDDLFGGGDDELFGGADADLFGGDLLMEADASANKRSLADELLAADKFVLGGFYSADVTATWDGPRNGDAEVVDSRGPRLGLDVTSTMYADMRPSKDGRLFVKGRVDAQGSFDALRQWKPTATLLELFADFHARDRVYFRLGKQTIHWGVGYFFSPADIINIGRIDPENPEADREGPVALKTHMPVGSNNFYVHLIADDVRGESHFAVAPKAEWLAGDTEIGLGAYYRGDRAPRLMATTSGSAGKWALFSEFVTSYGSDKRFVAADADEPLGVRSIRREDEWFVHGTFGALRSWSDRDGRFNIGVSAQYYYNGEGYAPDHLENILHDYGPGLGALLASGQLSPADLQQPGRHYGALAVNWSRAFGSRLSPGLFWLGNLQDGSGLVTASVGVRTWDKVRLSVEARRAYGSKTSEYGALGDDTVVTIRFGYSDNF